MAGKLTHPPGRAVRRPIARQDRLRVAYPAVVAQTVLVVDDDPVIQRLLQVNFEMEDYVVLTASDGAEGLAKARTEKPDILLLDVMMPKMDGIAVAQALRADPDTADLPIIMLTAKAQAADIQAGRDVGVDMYVTKPFDPLELIETVRSLLD